MSPIASPAPYQGVNEQIPVMALQFPNCEKLLNFNVTQAGIELRNGDANFSIVGAAQGYTLGCMAPFGNTKLLLFAYNSVTTLFEVRDGEAGTSIGASAGPVAIPTEGLQHLFFNNYLYFFSGETANPGFTYNSAGVFGALGYTGTAPFQPFGGDVYKDRAYLIQYNEAAYFYSGISSISGATTKVDLTYVISESSTLAIIERITLSDTTSTTELQAFVFFSGEVLFYSGSYPNGSDWTLAGRAVINTPLNYNAGVRYGGDFLVFTDSGVVSLRDLFLKGSEVAQNDTNNNVRVTWQNLVTGLRSLRSLPTGPVRGVEGTWDQANDRIIISFPVSINDSGTVANGNFFFIYYTVLKSWYYHWSFGPGTTQIVDICTYKNKVLFVGCGTTQMTIWEKEGASDFMDDNITATGEVAYDYQVKSAPIAAGREYVQRALGMDVIMNSDLYGETNFQFVKDLGVTTTTAQKVSGVPTGSLQKPFVNMGIDGSFIQYKISGTTAASKSTGLKIYGTNIWTQQGSRAR